MDYSGLFWTLMVLGTFEWLSIFGHTFLERAALYILICWPYFGVAQPPLISVFTTLYLM
jgi:hypothetical protein